MMDMREETSGPRRRSTLRSSRWRGVPVLFAAVLAGAGCDVTNPGNILDENLDREDAFQALVNGMAGDFAPGPERSEQRGGSVCRPLW